MGWRTDSLDTSLSQQDKYCQLGTFVPPALPTTSGRVDSPTAQALACGALYLFTVAVPFLYVPVLANAAHLPRWVALEVLSPMVCALALIAWCFSANRSSQTTVPLALIPAGLLVALAFLTGTWAIDQSVALTWAPHHMGVILTGALAAYTAFAERQSRLRAHSLVLGWRLGVAHDLTREERTIANSDPLLALAQLELAEHRWQPHCGQWVGDDSRYDMEMQVRRVGVSWAR
ncbi:hypothetical protein ACFL59_03725 [Planctomycetota bacterium]